MSSARCLGLSSLTMKLRILDNSIRLRLDRSEIRQLLRTGTVERQTCFGPDSAFVYTLSAVAQEAELSAVVGTGRIDVFVDATRAAQWASSGEASIEAEQEAGRGTLRLLVEKDFPCQHTGEADAAEKFTPTTMQIDANGPLSA